MKIHFNTYRKLMALSTLAVGLTFSALTSASVFPEGAELEQLYTDSQFT